MECVKWKALTEDLFNHCLNLWGEEIKYHAVSGDTYTVSGIVDLTSLMVDPDTHTTIQSIQP